MIHDSLIQSCGLTRSYLVGKMPVTALSDVTFEIPRGGFTALVGPSGSGKSTLLNLIGGLDRPTGGDIQVDGLSLNSATERQLDDYRRTRVGFIFQSFNLMPALTALENVETPMILAEVARAERRARAASLLESVGLGERGAHRPNEMSGGEKQRVAIARALVNRPALLLADEPTGNLDSRSGATVLDLLCGLVRQTGLTLVMVTHDLEVAGRADRIIHLRDGRIHRVETKSADTLVS